MNQQDTIVSQQETPAVKTDSGVTVSAHRITPYQVLRMLPRDATPDQQDSAIQAWFQPSQIRYSNRPDTLHLPGHDVPVDLSVVNIPVYYREVFFAKELAAPESHPGRYGVAGDPVPYTVRGDNTMTLLLLFCVLFFIFLMSRSQRFIVRQLKDFFFLPHADEAMTETSGELQLQLFLVMQTCLLLAICLFFYATRVVADTYVLDSDLQLIGLFFAMTIGYFLLRSGLYSVVNSVFFDSKRNLQWQHTLLFIASAEGVLLLPAVLLQVYFDISLENVTYYYVFVLLLAKILTFYKCWSIFFRQNVFSLQIILYFCALEIVPLLAYAGGLWTVTNILKINF